MPAETLGIRREFQISEISAFEDERITVREPHLEAMSGTEVGIVGYANRPINSAQLTIKGFAPIPGQLNKEEPTVVKFSLPPLMEDGSIYRFLRSRHWGKGDDIDTVYDQGQSR